MNLASNYAGGSFNPRIMVDATGAVDVVWVEDNTAQPHYDLFFSRSNDGGLSFSTPINVSLNPGAETINQPWMAVNSNGTIYVAWRLIDNSSFTPQGIIYFSRSADGGLSFSPPLALSTHFSVDDPQLGVDASGNIDVVWSETGANGSHVEFSRSTDGGSTFSVPQQITAEEGVGGPTHAYLVVGSNGGINVLSLGFHIHFTHSSDGGATFSEADVSGQEAIYDCCSPFDTPMAVDSIGNIYVVWFSEVSPQSTLFSKSTDGGITFSAPKTVSNNPALNRAQIAVDSKGVIRVANFESGCCGGQGAYLFFTTSTDGGATFSSPVNSVLTDSAVTSVQTVQDSSGNINLVWLDDVNLSGSGFGSNNNLQVSWNISRDGGLTFSPTINVSNDPNQAGGPMLALDPPGNAYLVWTEFPFSGSQSLGIRFSRSTSLISLSVNPSTVTGSISSTGAVTLSAPAFSGGATIVLSSSDWSVASVLNTVTVPAGATTASFPINTGSVSFATSVTITGTYAGQSQAGSLTLEPPSVAALTLNPASVTGGNPSTGTVTLNVPASAGGASVSLSGSDKVVSVSPFSSVSVPPFASSVSFTVFTSPVAQPDFATISASSGGVTQTASLTVTPTPQAQVVFTDPRNISNSPGASAGQQVAVDSQGNIYVVWVDNTPGNNDIFFTRSTDGGTTFSAPQNLSNNTGDSIDADIAVDSGGNIDIVWADNTPGNYDIFFTRSTDGGTTFSAAQNISTNAGASLGPLMAVDSAGNINVIWVDSTPGNRDLFFSRGANGGTTFSTPQNLTPSNVGPFASTPVQIAADLAGNIDVLFRFFGQTDTSVKFIRSTDGGGTFSAPRQMSPTSEGGPDTRMAVDASGNIDFVIVNGQPSSTISFTRTTDGGATFSPQIIISSGNGRGAQVTVDTFGGIHIVWQASATVFNSIEGIAYTHSTDNGASFSPPQELSGGASEGVGQQLAVDAKGNITVVWQSFANQILFSRSSDGGTTFSFPQNLSNDSGQAEAPLLAADAAGNINVLWADNTPGNFDIFFSRGMPPGSLSSIAINPASATGGNSSVATVTLVSPAPPGGAAVSLQSSNWNLASVPDPVIVPEGARTATINVATSTVSQATSVRITASYAGENQTASLTVTPPALSANSLQPAGVIGGSAVKGTVTLNQQAPAGGIVVSLLSSDTTVAAVPATVTVPQWATSASYPVTTTAVAQQAAVSISASSGSATQIASLTVAPPTPMALLLDQQSVQEGGGCTGTVELNGPAPDGGALVSLSSNEPTVASVPTTVTVPAGSTTATFVVNTNSVTQSTSVTFSASYQGQTQTVSLAVTP